MSISDIINSDDPYKDITDILEVLHAYGPSDPLLLEQLSYYKLFHGEFFGKLEERIVSSLGLFYKNTDPKNIYSFILSGFGESHKSDYGSYLTPVQASIRRGVNDSQFISISAPTSAGKSYSIRDFIADSDGDAVIVVPSRALIAEYINAMRRKFNENKNIMISSFVDKVFTSRNLRRIFVITPERSRDLFRVMDQLDVRVFFFDEAHVSEEEDRGIVFDVMVRRIIKNYPEAKLIFAHPFVENPEAQFSKHAISGDNKFHRSYTQGAVGRVSVFSHSNGTDYYFSPYIDGGYRVKNCRPFNGSFKNFAFNGGHTILVYVSKASIYKGDFLDEFLEYIDALPSVTNEKALEIINSIRELLGADDDKNISDLVTLLRKGVVIHHGSVPLDVRFLVEDFIRFGFARICFATSTLAQGINMPFDIVWLENPRMIGGDESNRALSFKNLIGRAGRLSDDNVFDFGYVYTKNAKKFSERIQSKYYLKIKSIIEDYDIDKGAKESSDSEELLLAIRNNTFDEDKNLPITKIERLSEQDILDMAKAFLDILYQKDTITEAIGGNQNKFERELAGLCLKLIYESSLGRRLYQGETVVFETAISLFFLVIQGYTFKEIAGLRYSYISRRDEGGFGNARFSQPANQLPDSNLKKTFSLFSVNTPANLVRFDAIIYDTYDYLDKVISFSLSENFSSAFKIYYEKTGDGRALKMVELLRYGTSDPSIILLIRYGFPPEKVANILPYLELITESEIKFNNSIKDAPDHIRSSVEWYLPQT